MQLERKLQTARSHALLDHPFFGTLLCPMEMKVNNDIETFATNGVSIYYNEEYAESLTTELTMGVLLHEVMHPAFFHVTRRGTRNPMIWNEACDYAINPLLISYGIKLPEGALIDKKYDDWSADAIYNDLLSTVKEGNMPSSLGDVGGTGYFEDGEMTSSQKQEVENEWKQRLVGAAESCKLRGTVPGEFASLIEKFLEPKVLWGEKLRMYAHDLVRWDSSWSKPNKRYIDQGIYLPSVKRLNGISKLIVAVDDSGSAVQYLPQFGGELTSIFEECDIDECIVLYIDSAVNNVQRYTDDDLPIVIDSKGGGGTSFEPAFEWVEENNEEPTLFVYLTDMYGSFPEYEPDYPVIWVAYDSDPKYYEGNCHFGEIIEVE
jgi:predicted metal-dependent peptidase